ncbi:methyltransferase family protein [Paludibacterium purpuratum]|uniref:Protein-S-isoprenylcysteine O-methyltransferase Ste14 n=1 Tax=Paludibacterium purpuratum TaxID=1144873 RepID=A0A4R7B8N7_9NEIS|nr:isoprenylcysteine carboxylmethyltransferase family protein [Paludibacterium purpuratum]TDR80252.1 protein-S-isoprenylcysteine O-methyltransferase Ste14 [Paludibacterium purpuratum]
MNIWRFHEILLRACAVLAGSWFVHASWHQWRLQPNRLSLLLLMLGEGTVVLLLLISKVPKRRDWHPVSLFCTLVATYYFLAVRLTPGIHLVPESIGVLLQCTGLSWSLYAKWSLRRAFGLLPANRGVVTTGAYRVLRHPIYAGYLFNHLGFLLVSYCWQNLLVYTVLYSVQIIRLRREECILRDDPDYRDYCGHVRFRLIPGVF